MVRVSCELACAVEEFFGSGNDILSVGDKWSIHHRASESEDSAVVSYFRQ